MKSSSLILLFALLLLGTSDFVMAQSLKSVDRTAPPDQTTERASASIERLVEMRNRGFDRSRAVRATTGGARHRLNVSLAAGGFTARRIDRATDWQPSVRFHLTRAANGTVSWMKGDFGRVRGAGKGMTAYVAAAQAALADHAGLLRLEDPQAELRVMRAHTDALGSVHTRFEQQYRGVPVWGRDLYVHFDASGKLYAINGTYEPTPGEIDLSPAWTAQAARDRVVNELKAEGRWAPLTGRLAEGLGLDDPEPRLVLYPDQERGMRLAFEVDVHANLIEHFTFLLDARSGRILNRVERHCALNPNEPPPVLSIDDLNLPEAVTSTSSVGFFDANGADLNGIDQALRVHQVDDGTFFMYSDLDNVGNFTLPDVPQEGGALTLTANNADLGENAQISYITSGDNSWVDPATVSAHANMTVTYEYYRDRHGRKAINDGDESIISIVHVTQDSLPMDNAFWSGRIMAYGDGAQSFKPLAGALDVATHEMTHGVIDHTAQLVYQFQSGALNESFADVFGAMVDQEDFIMGEDIIATGHVGLRDLLNPDNPQALSGDPALNGAFTQPAHMDNFRQLTADQDNGGVHINSGIPNRAAALIIQQLGHDVTEQIYYRALDTYLTRNSQFGDARRGLEQAAIDLHGEGSAELTVVQQAFDAVGVLGGADGQTTDPDANNIPAVEGDVSLIAFVLPPGGTGTTGLPEGKIGYVNPFTGNAGVFDDAAAVALAGSQLSTPLDGSAIFFINTDGQLAFIDLADVTEENLGEAPVFFFPDLFINQAGDIRNASISPNGAITTLVSSSTEDANLYFSDGEEVIELPLITSTTGQGVENNGIQYADVVTWSSNPDELKIAFDALNASGGGVFTEASEFWAIFEIDFDAEQIYNLIPAQPGEVSVGNIVYTRTNPDIVAFNVIDEESQFDIFLANFETGDYLALELPTLQLNEQALIDSERPTFAPDDAFMAFSSVANNTLLFYNTEAEAGSPDAFNVLSFNEAGISPAYPNWFMLKGNVGQIIPNEDEPSLPTAARFHGSFPNPFTEATTLRFDLDTHGRVALEVFDLLGRRVTTLVDRELSIGTHEARFEARDLPAGTYFARLTVGDRVEMQKLVVTQ